MPKSAGRPKGSARIRPARIEELPTVLDADEVANVLRRSREEVCRLANEGRLHRLAYSRREFLFWSAEVERFLAEESGHMVALIGPQERSLPDREDAP